MYIEFGIPHLCEKGYSYYPLWLDWIFADCYAEKIALGLKH